MKSFWQRNWKTLLVVGAVICFSAVMISSTVTSVIEKRAIWQKAYKATATMETAVKDVGWVPVTAMSGASKNDQPNLISVRLNGHDESLLVIPSENGLMFQVEKDGSIKAYLCEVEVRRNGGSSEAWYFVKEKPYRAPNVPF